MTVRKKKTIALSLLLAFSFLLISKGSNVSINNETTLQVREVLGSKTMRTKDAPLSQIYITGSNWSQAKIMGYCTGNGTLTDPYLIQNFEIDATNSSTGSGILIENSDAYFIIHNCSISNANDTWADAGIKISNANNGALLNNTCSFNNRFGICVQNGDNTVMSGNSVFNNSQNGIFVERSDGLIIFQNEIFYNDENKTYEIGARGTGVNILSCELAIIMDNRVIENYRGVHFAKTNYSFIANNFISGNLYHGVLSDHSHGNYILENKLQKNGGIGIIASGSGYNISNNEVTLHENNGIQVTDGNGSVVKENTIHLSDENGILGMNCTHLKIESNSITSSRTNGIELVKCLNASITSNHISYCQESGIILDNSSGNTIAYNNIKRNGEYGILLRKSDNNTVIKNRLMFNQECIYEQNCQGNSFSGNICSKLVIRYSIIGGVGMVVVIAVPVTIVVIKKKRPVK
jgi:parallel beta-helix repeat protein